MIIRITTFLELLLGVINHENFARRGRRYYCRQIVRRLGTDLRHDGLSGHTGLEARVEKDALRLQWQGKAGQQLRASFAIENDRPIIRELAVQNKDSPWG